MNLGPLEADGYACADCVSVCVNVSVCVDLFVHHLRQWCRRVCVRDAYFTKVFKRD